MEKGNYSIEFSADDAALLHDLQSFNKKMQGFQDQQVKDNKVANDTIEMANTNSLRQQKKAFKDHVNNIQSIYKQQIKAATGDIDKQVDLHKKMLETIESAEKKHADRVKVLRSQGGVGKMTGGIKEKFMTGFEEGGKGVIGTLTGITKVLGPVGTAAAAVFGTVTAVMAKASEAAKEFETNTAKVATLLSKEDAKKLPEAMESLKKTAATTGAPLEELQGTLGNILGAIPSMGSDLGAASTMAEKAAKTAIGLASGTESVVGAANNLANALGISMTATENQDKIFDTLSQTMNVGVIPSGEALAGAIADAAPTMAALTANSMEALNAIGAMTAQLTANGISVDEAQTGIKALGNELLTTATRTKLMKDGIEGIDASTGKITDWSKLIDSVAQHGEAMITTFSSSESQNALRVLAKNGGADFKGMMDSMENAGGTADKMYQTMAETSEQQGKRMDAAWNNILISMGQSTNGVVGQVKGFAADALSWVAGLFETSEQKFQAAMDSAQKMNDVAATMAGLGDLINASMAAPPDEATIAHTFDVIKSHMAEIKEADPIIAQDMEAILNNPNSKTVENLSKMNDLLKNVAETAQGFAEADAAEAQAQSFEVLNDKIADAYAASQGFVGSVGQILGFTKPMEKLGFDVVKEQIKENNTELVTLKQNYQAAKDAGNWEEVRNVQKDILEIQRDQAKLGGLQKEINAGITESVKRALAAQVEANQGSTDGIDKAIILQDIYASLPDEMRGSSAVMEQFTKELNSQLGTLEGQNNEREVQLGIEQDSIMAQEYVNQLMVDQGITEQSSTAEKIKGLEAISAQLGAQISSGEAVIATGEASLHVDVARATAMNMLVNLQNELNKSMGVEAAGKTQDVTRMQELINQTKAQVGALKQQKGAIDKQIAELKKGGGGGAAAAAGAKKAGGGGGKSSTDKKAEDEKKKADDAEKERLKRMEELHKEEMDRIKKEIDAKKKAQDERFKEEDRLKALAEEEKKLRQDLNKALDEFAAGLRDAEQQLFDANLGDLGSITSKFLTPLQQAELAAQKVRERQQNADLDLVGKIKDLGISIADTRRQLDEVNREINSQKEALTKANTNLSDFGQQLDETNQTEKLVQSTASNATQSLSELQATAKSITDLLAIPSNRRGDIWRGMVQTQLKLTPAQGVTGAAATTDLINQINRLSASIEAGIKEAEAAKGGIDQATKNVIESQRARAQGMQSIAQAAADRATSKLEELNKQATELESTLTGLRTNIQSAYREQNKVFDEQVSGLTEESTRLAAIVAQREQIADLQKQAMEEPSLTKSVEIMRQVLKLRGALGEELATQGVTEEGLLTHIESLHQKVTSALATQRNLTVEQIKDYTDISMLLKQQETLGNKQASLSDKQIQDLETLLPILEESGTYSKEQIADYETVIELAKQQIHLTQDQKDLMRLILDDVTETKTITAEQASAITNVGALLGEAHKLQLDNAHATEQSASSTLKIATFYKEAVDYSKQLGEYSDKDLQYLTDKVAATKEVFDLQHRINNLNRELGTITAEQLDAEKAAFADMKTAEAEHLAYIQQQVKAIEDLHNGLIDQAGSYTEKMQKGFQDALDKFNETKSQIGKAQGEGTISNDQAQKDLELAGKAFKKEVSTAAATAIVKLAEGLNTAIDIVQSGVDKTFEIIDKIGLGDVKGTIQSVGDLTMLVGKALLQGPYPLNIIGAIILGAGLLMQASAKIYDMIEGIQAKTDQLYQRQMDRLDATKEELKLLDRENEALKKHLELQDKINNQFKRYVDSGAKQASENMKHISDLGSQVMNDMMNLNTNAGFSFTLPDLTDINSVFSTMQQMNDQEMKDKERLAHLDNILDDTKAHLSKRDRQRFEAERDQLNSNIEAYDSIIENLSQYADYYEQIDDLRRQILQDSIDEIDHQKAVTDYETESLYLEGKITEEEYNRRKKGDDLKALEDRLAAQKKLAEQAKRDYDQNLITRDELWSFEQGVRDTELEILRLKKEQNGEDTKALDNIRKLYKERQALIMKSRDQGLAPDEKKRIKELERNIVTEMQAQGATPEAVQAAVNAFLNAAPSYDTGVSYVPGDLFANIHEGERILTKTENEQMIAALQQYKDGLRPIQDLAQAYLQQKEAMNALAVANSQISIGSIVINTQATDAAGISRDLKGALYNEFAKYHDNMHRKNGTLGGR